MAGMIESTGNYSLTEDINGELCFSLVGVDSIIPDKINEIEFSRLIIRRVDFDHVLLKDILNINKIREFTNEYGGTNIKFIEGLSELESLTLTFNTKEQLNFSGFNNLKFANIKWQKKYSDDLFKLNAITTLILTGYPDSDINHLMPLTNLNFLQLERCKTSSLMSIKSLVSLGTLYLTSLKNLTDLSPLEGNNTIENLSISRCNNVKDLKPINTMLKCKKLILGQKEIPSLKFLEGNKTLERLELSDSNVLDGDLDVLLSLSKLKEVYFKNRRHYSKKMDDFK